MFWLLSALQLLFLSRTLPRDQDAMEAELAQYAEQAMITPRVDQAAAILNASADESHPNELETVVSIEERVLGFDGEAAQQTLQYVSTGLAELNPFRCGTTCSTTGSNSSDDDEEKESHATESSRLL